MDPHEASADEVAVEQLLSDLSRLRLEPHKPSLRYRFGLAAVAFGMVLLPAVYFAAVGLLGYWIAATLLDPPPPSHLNSWVLYLLLVATGPVCIFFLLKPWFARGQVDQSTVRLEPGEAPNLECFVGLMARAVGAPGPTTIELDCSVNAAAGFRGGWRGMVHQELKLTLGLPLIAGLDMRSFAGVLSHELGHFSQRAGMRLAWFIMLINERFERLVHARDRWDLYLAEAARSERPVVQAFGLMTLSLVWLCRQPLRLLIVAGKGISGIALRQLEFDADGYEIVFAGSDAFRRTSREINLLNVGAAKALRLVGETLPEGHLPRNLPKLARVQTDALSDTVRAAVEQEMMAESARFALFKGSVSDGLAPGFFSTHPCDRERIEIAESYGAPGLIHLGVAARELFEDFEASSERITTHFYGTQFDLDLGDCELVDNARFDGTVRVRERLFDACERFFDGRFTVARPLLFRTDELKLTLAGRYEADPEAAPAVARWLEEGGQCFDQFDQAEEDMLRAARAAELFQAGFRIRRKAFGLARGLAALSDQQRDAAARRDQALVKLAKFDLVARRTLLSATAIHLADADRAEQKLTRKVLRALGAIGDQFQELLKLRRVVLAQRALLQNLSSASLGRPFVERLQRNSIEMSDRFASLGNALAKVRYPFPHASGRISVADYANAEFNEARAIIAAYRKSEAMLERVFDLYFRLVGYLCLIAEGADPDPGK